ncbi:MAG: D-lyxose/D-mannose family sugar isomerase [Pseudomonadota bacterium]
MHRSTINEHLRAAQAFFDSHNVRLPPFAHLEPTALASLTDTSIIKNRLGWDVTDYGRGQFEEYGLLLFTARNGTLANLTAQRGIVYAEKMMISRHNQYSPMHRHYTKTEDIINRAGARLVIELFAPNEEGFIDRDAEVEVAIDGLMKTFPAGTRVALDPGESITLEPGVWHAFWGEGGDVLVGEVSTVNDDEVDNWFEEDIGRFSTVVEDEPAWRLLVSDYPTLTGS